MSFEGYWRAICKNGHFRENDVYIFDPTEEKCSCGEKFVWRELIDQTNGLEGVKQTCIEKISEIIGEKCPTCGTITKIIDDDGEFPRILDIPGRIGIAQCGQCVFKVAHLRYFPTSAASSGERPPPTGAESE